MPAAPTLEALFDTQVIIEDAFAAYFLANGLPAYTSRSADDMPDARVSVQYEEGGSQANHQSPASITHTGDNEQDWFTGSLSLTVNSETAVDGASPDPAIDGLHNYRVCRLKALMAKGSINGRREGVTALAIPYHRLVYLSYSGKQDGAGDGMAESSLSYSLQIAIQSDAWPAAVTP